MERRTLLVAGAALATAGATRASAARGKMPGMVMEMSMDECIDLCMKSQRVCLDAASRLSQQAATPTQRQLVILISDCAELCGMTANSMVRGSPLLRWFVAPVPKLANCAPSNAASRQTTTC